MEAKFAVQVLDFRFRKCVQNFRNLTENVESDGNFNGI